MSVAFLMQLLPWPRSREAEVQEHLTLGPKRSILHSSTSQSITTEHIKRQPWCPDLKPLC